MTSRHLMPLPALVAFALAAAPASATTFCVPTFHTGCPNNGTNVAQASFETALTTNGSDGIADRVLVAPLIVTDPDTIEASGSDALEIAGAGPADTILTSSDNGNQFVLNLANRGGGATVRDLRIAVPASFPDGLGSGAQVKKATVENVDVESRNPGSDGIVFVGGGSFRDGEVYATSGGSVGYGIWTNDSTAGQLTVERSRITSPSWGVFADGPGVPVTVNRVTITDPVAYGVRANGGGQMTVRNTLITSKQGYALSAGGLGAGDSLIDARNVTIVGLPGVPNAAIEAKVFNAVGNGDATITVRDSIIRGHPNAFNRTAPAFGVGVGNANITFSHTIVNPVGIEAGDGQVTYGAGNLNVDPLFLPGYALPATSPAVDAGDPAGGGPTDDHDGAARPRDGNGDGTARNDLGAFEYQPPAAPQGPGPAGGGSSAPAGPATPASPAGPAADTTAPSLTGLKVLRPFTSRKGGRVRLTLSEPARVTLTFTAADRRARPRTVRRTFRAKAGRNTLKVRARALKARGYRLSAVAVDPAGNRSKAVRRKLRVRR